MSVSSDIKIRELDILVNEIIPKIKTLKKSFLEAKNNNGKLRTELNETKLLLDSGKTGENQEGFWRNIEDDQIAEINEVEGLVNTLYPSPIEEPIDPVDPPIEEEIRSTVSIDVPITTKSSPIGT